MFRQSTVQKLFRLASEDGYVIDVELLVWGHRLGYAIREIPVLWHEVPGSKVRLWRELFVATDSELQSFRLA